MRRSPYGFEVFDDCQTCHWRTDQFFCSVGDDALREMCDVRHVSVDRVHMAKDPLWYPYTDKAYAWYRKGLRAMFSGGFSPRLPSRRSANGAGIRCTSSATCSKPSWRSTLRKN